MNRFFIEICKKTNYTINKSYSLNESENPVMTISIFIDACVSAALFAIIFLNSLSETINFRYQFLMFLVTLFCNFFLIQYSWVGYLTIILLEIIIVIATKNHLINVLASLGGYILSITSNYLLLFLSSYY